MNMDTATGIVLTVEAFFFFFDFSFWLGETVTSIMKEHLLLITPYIGLCCLV